MKHRLGYTDYGHRIIPVNQGEFEMPIQQQLKQDPTPTTTELNKLPFVAESSNSQESSSSASNSQEQPNFSENFARDARLQFLRQILQRIKQNAEQMVNFLDNALFKIRSLLNPEKFFK
jgi:replicative superfamily II helicase